MGISLDPDSKEPNISDFEPFVRRYERAPETQACRHRPADCRGILLAGPFVVTQEVWMLAENMTIFHSLFLVGVVMAIGYGGLYGADNDRDPNREAIFLCIPVRFISVMIVAFSSVTLEPRFASAPQARFTVRAISDEAPLAPDGHSREHSTRGQ